MSPILVGHLTEPSGLVHVNDELIAISSTWNSGERRRLKSSEVKARLKHGGAT